MRLPQTNLWPDALTWISDNSGRCLFRRERIDQDGRLGYRRSDDRESKGFGHTARPQHPPCQQSRYSGIPLSPRRPCLLAVYTPIRPLRTESHPCLPITPAGRSEPSASICVRELKNIETRWLPIMKAYEQGIGAYFATPPVNLIYALNASLTTITKSPEVSLEERFRLHKEASQRVKSAANELGLAQVSDPKSSSNGMTAVSHISSLTPNGLPSHPCSFSFISPRDSLLRISSRGSQQRMSSSREDCTRISRTATSVSGASCISSPSL